MQHFSQLSCVSTVALTAPPVYGFGSELHGVAVVMAHRIYMIWNRGYKTQMVVAASPDDAVRLSCASGHFRKVGNYRKWEDCTDHYLMSGDYPHLQELLNRGVAGVAEYTDEGWKLDGKLIDL